LDLLEDLHALAQLPWEWHIAGSGSVDPAFAECLRVRIGEAGLAPRVIFHGVLDPPGVAALLAASDLFVFPSRYEAYGMAIAEAAAAGVPILTTAVGEAARLVRDGKTGLVLAPDDRAGFRDAVARLLGDAALRERLRATLRTDLVRTWPDAFEDFWSGLEAVLGEVKVNAAGPRATPPPNGSSPG
jgi:glycosyltransferase involved in cell wall biosynthesis